jgi:metal-dependent hydrolase (beta-lactamase superfamily II)
MNQHLQRTVTDLKKFGLKLISPCHCAGFKATATLWRAYPEIFALNFSGRVIEAGKETKPRVT